MNKQHIYYLSSVFFVNTVFILMGFLSPVGAINILVVGITHFRDALFVIIRVLFRPCIRQHPEEEEQQEPDVEKGNQERKVLCVIPTYKEEPAEVIATLVSLLNQDDAGVVQKRVVMVADGFLKYSEVFSSIILIHKFQYTTFKKKTNEVSVFYCTYEKFDGILLLLKHENAGKKDSLLLVDDIFVENVLARERHVLLKFYNISEFHYIFHTDADSVLSANTIRRQSKIMHANPKISGVTGIVLVPEQWTFWSLFQGFQYFYGQLIRRMTESMWGKPTCMPGCTNMINISHDCIIHATERYRKLPSKKQLFQMKNRLQGTDRRYTNCVLQYSYDVRIVTDYESHCYTIPPQTFDHFRSQRKRWTSNAITGYFFLLFGSNIPWYVRTFAAIDIFRIHTSITRLVSTFVFLTNIQNMAMIQVVMMAIVFGIPYIMFVYHIIKLKKYGWFLFVGSVLSKFVSPFITVYNFLYCIYNFPDISWGLSHGAVSGVDAAIKVTDDYPVREDDPETLV